MMDRGGHHMMDRVHFMMDRLDYMMDRVHHMMDRLYYVMDFFGKVLFYLYAIHAMHFQTIHLVDLQVGICAEKLSLPLRCALHSLL